MDEAESRIAVLVLKGALKEMGPEMERRVDECAGKIRALVQEYGPKEAGAYALALVGAEVGHA